MFDISRALVWQDALMHSNLLDMHDTDTTITHSNNMLYTSSSSSSSMSSNNHAMPKSPLLWTSGLEKGDNTTTSHQVVKTDKQGRVVLRIITKLSRADLQGLDQESSSNSTSSSMSIQEASVGRERLLELLRDAGVLNVEAPVITQLPTWRQVAALYYTDQSLRDVTDAGPVIVGLERCEQFRRTVPVRDASVAVAGLFNTGTNPAAMYLAANCQMPYNTMDKSSGHSMRWQVPWGKHMLANRKWNNTARHDVKVNKNHVLPVILIRDPYTWMQSMCRHPYAAHWPHAGADATAAAAADQHCPNLVTTNGSSIPVSIKYPGEKAEWDSLVHLWSDWYNQYLNADYPRLMVRYVQPQTTLFLFQEHCLLVHLQSHSFLYLSQNANWRTFFPTWP